MPTKPKFKKKEIFFHPEQQIFIVIDDMIYMSSPNTNGDHGWLYTLKCFKHKGDGLKPYKRYYESKMIEVLTPLKKSNAVKVLYGK